MTTDTVNRLRRELLIVTAVERLLATEVGHMYRWRDVREAQEWDAGEAATEIQAEISEVKLLREQLHAARQELQRELREVEAQGESRQA